MQTPNLEPTLVQKYILQVQPHGINNGLSLMDTMLRECIGKTEGVEVGKCSHNAILERERDAAGKNPEHYCRCCGLYLNVNGIGRSNDFLIIRNRKCRGPICLECIEKRPDVWHQAFQKGLKKYNLIRNYQNASEEVLEDLESFDKLYN